MSTTYWRTKLGFLALVILLLIGLGLFAVVALVERVWFCWYSFDGS